jgi:hypothetical protein
MILALPPSFSFDSPDSATFCWQVFTNLISRIATVPGRYLCGFLIFSGIFRTRRVTKSQWAAFCITSTIDSRLLCGEMLPGCFTSCRLSGDLLTASHCKGASEEGRRGSGKEGDLTVARREVAKGSARLFRSKSAASFTIIVSLPARASLVPDTAPFPLPPLTLTAFRSRGQQ